MEVRFNKPKKQLKLVAKDPAFTTPLQHLVVADMLSAIFAVVQPDRPVKFQFFKENGSWGFKAIND